MFYSTYLLKYGGLSQLQFRDLILALDQNLLNKLYYESKAYKAQFIRVFQKFGL